MGINNAPEQIEIVSEIIGIDLTPANKRVYELATISRQLRAERAATMGEARSVAIKAATGSGKEFAERWETARQMVLTTLAVAELEEAASEANQKAQDKAAEEAAFTALGMTKEYVKTLAQKLGSLDLYNIKTAEAAIAANATKDYTEANEILDQLIEIAGIPCLSNNESPWVLISPPELPEVRTAGDVQRPKLRDVESAHPVNEYKLIKQAVEIRKAGTLREKLLSAIRNGWNITPAQNNRDIRAREARHTSAAWVSDGGVTRAID